MSTNEKINKIKQRKALLLSWAQGIRTSEAKASDQKGYYKKQINLDSVRKLAKDFKLMGEDDMAEKLSCAISAIAGTEEPKTEYSYSYVMRKLRKGDKDRRLEFQRVFKDSFDEAMDEGLSDPEQIALLAAIKQIEFSD